MRVCWAYWQTDYLRVQWGVVSQGKKVRCDRAGYPWALHTCKDVCTWVCMYIYTHTIHIYATYNTHVWLEWEWSLCVFLNYTYSGWWKNGSFFKSTGDPTPSSDIWRHQVCIWCTYIHVRQNTPTHKTENINKYCVCVCVSIAHCMLESEHGRQKRVWVPEVWVTGIGRILGYCMGAEVWTSVLRNVQQAFSTVEPFSILWNKISLKIVYFFNLKEIRHYRRSLCVSLSIPVTLEILIGFAKWNDIAKFSSYFEKQRTK